MEIICDRKGKETIRRAIKEKKGKAKMSNEQGIEII